MSKFAHSSGDLDYPVAEAGHDVQAADGDLPEAAAGGKPPVHRMSNHLFDWPGQSAVLKLVYIIRDISHFVDTGTIFS